MEKNFCDLVEKRLTECRRDSHAEHQKRGDGEFTELFRRTICPDEKPVSEPDRG